MDKKYAKALTGGLFSNPVFVLVLGTCPTIAKSTNITDAFGLGVATAFVLIFSNLVISALRKVIPDKVRLPAYIIVIATFVTLVQLFLNSFLPALNESIGAFIPLIVVNCIILGRAEAFASKNDVLSSVIDGASMGIGFIAAITLMGACRQFLSDVLKIAIFKEAAGGFLVFGLLMALFNFVLNFVMKKRDERKNLLSPANPVIKED